MIVLSNVPEMHHATVIVRMSLALHLANAWILVRMLPRRSLLTSQYAQCKRKTLSFALFLATITWSMHPLRVENVAWASCLPHTLANTFAMLCVNAHLNRIVLDSKCHFDSILFITIMYALSVFSKTSTIALPGYLFILSVQRYGMKICNMSTLKLMLCMGFVSCVAFLQASKAKIPGLHSIRISVRSSHITFRYYVRILSICIYVLKTIWPVSITTWYPIPQWVVIATSRDIFMEMFSFSTGTRCDVWHCLFEFTSPQRFRKVYICNCSSPFIYRTSCTHFGGHFTSQQCACCGSIRVPCVSIRVCTVHHVCVESLRILLCVVQIEVVKVHSVLHSL